MFSENQILVPVWKGQVQHSTMDNTTFQTIFVTQNF